MHQKSRPAAWRPEPDRASREQREGRQSAKNDEAKNTGFAVRALANHPALPREHKLSRKSVAM